MQDTVFSKQEIKYNNMLRKDQKDLRILGISLIKGEGKKLRNLCH